MGIITSSLDARIIADNDTSKRTIYTCPVHGVYTIANKKIAEGSTTTDCPYYSCDREGIIYE